MKLTRTEFLVFKATLDKAGIDRHVEEIKTIGFSCLLGAGEGDTGLATYTVCLQYLGEVEEKLMAFSRLVEDPGVVTSASIEELTEGRSILVGLVEQITRIGDMLARKESAEGPSTPTIASRLRDWWAR